MLDVDVSELIAELILRPHACSSLCACWELRKLPAIEEAIQKLEGKGEGS